MWPMDSCRVLFGQSPSIGHALRIGMDGGPSIAWKIDATGKSKRLAFNYSDPADYLTVPSVGAAHGRMGLSVAESLSHERRITASIFTLACCHANWQQALELRHVLVKQCSMASAGMRFVRPRASRQLHPCATTRPVLAPRCSAVPVPRSRATQQCPHPCVSPRSLPQLHVLMPAGGWPSRTPAIVDAMACGCIPVFFHSAQLELWPAHLGGWRATRPSSSTIARSSTTRPRGGPASGDLAGSHSGDAPPPSRQPPSNCLLARRRRFCNGSVGEP